MKTNLNKYYLQQLLKGHNVMMYPAEIEAIKQYLKSEQKELLKRVSTTELSNNKYLLCRIR